ncbi:polysaccharide biosynthesis C-terminal domain-containing protein [Candidatus Omnitrophota bacterium]
MLKDNIKKISARSAIFNYIGKSVLAVVDAVAFILITKKLTIDDYGIYAFSLAVLTFFAFFLPLGLPNALARFIPEYFEKGKKDAAVFITRVSLCIIIALGTFLIASAFFVSDNLSFIFKIGQLKELFFLLVLAGVLKTIARTGEVILNSLFLQIYRNLCQILTSLLQLSLFIIVLYYELGIKALIMAISVAALFQSLVYFVKVFSHFSDVKLKKKPSGDELKRFYIFSTKEYLFKIFSFFWDMSFDIYIIAYLLGPRSAGLFGFAASISFFLFYWSPGMVVQPIISPLFVRQHTRHRETQELNKLFQFYNKFKAFFAFPMVLGVWLLADKFVMVVYQGKFISAVLPLKILVLFIMLQAFMRPMKNIFDVLEKNEFPLYSNIIIIYRILASLLLIRYFGITGAACAYGSSIMFIFLIQLFFLKRIIKINYPIGSFLKILFNSLIMAVAVLTLRHYAGNSLLWIIITALAGILIYFSLSFINKPFRKEERDLINNGLGVAAWHF